MTTPPCHGAVICNCCWNCSTVRSHGTFREIIPNKIHQTIEIVNNHRILTNDACVRVNVNTCLLFSVICQDCINSNGSDDRWNRSLTKNSLPCQCRVFTVGGGGAFPGASGVDLMTATSAYTCFTSSSFAPTPLDLTFFYAGLCTLVCFVL